MKKIAFITFILLFSAKINAQETEKLFVPYYIIQDSVNSFERISAKTEVRAIGFGYGGVNQYMTIFNSKHSSTRFKENEIPKFIIELDEETDPLEFIIISKADIVKKRKTYRRFVKNGHAYGGAKDLSAYQFIPELKKIKNNLYEIIFTNKLIAGEYAFHPIYKGEQASNINLNSGKIRIYCFGIDK